MFVESKGRKFVDVSYSIAKYRFITESGGREPHYDDNFTSICNQLHGHSSTYRKRQTCNEEPGSFVTFCDSVGIGNVIFHVSNSTLKQCSWYDEDCKYPFYHYLCFAMYIHYVYNLCADIRFHLKINGRYVNMGSYIHIKIPYFELRTGCHGRLRAGHLIKCEFILRNKTRWMTVNSKCDAGWNIEFDDLQADVIKVNCSAEIEKRNVIAVSYVYLVILLGKCLVQNSPKVFLKTFTHI